MTGKKAKPDGMTDEQRKEMMKVRILSKEIRSIVYDLEEEAENLYNDTPPYE